MRITRAKSHCHTWKKAILSIASNVQITLLCGDDVLFTLVRQISFVLLVVAMTTNKRNISDMWLTKVPDVLLQLVVLFLAVDRCQVHAMVPAVLRRSIPVCLKPNLLITPRCDRLPINFNLLVYLTNWNKYLNV